MLNGNDDWLRRTMLERNGKIEHVNETSTCDAILNIFVPIICQIFKYFAKMVVLDDIRFNTKCFFDEWQWARCMGYC